MGNDAPAPRRGSPLFDPEEDRPPPRKKREKISRFFPGGKSVVGSLPNNHKRANDDTSNATPLVDDQAYTAQPRNQALNTTLSGSFQSTAMGFTSRDGNNELAHSTVQLRSTAPSKNRFSQAATPLKGFEGRDKRRDGIVGLSSLVQPASKTPLVSYPLPQGNGDFTVGPPRNPFQGTAFSAQPVSPEDAARYQAAYGNANHELPRASSSSSSRFQESSQPFRSSRRLPSDATQPYRSLPSAGSQHQGQHPPTPKDVNPLNAPPPQIKTTRSHFSDQGLQQPFLPRPQVIAAGVDLDRDGSGKKLPAQMLRPILNLPNQGITNLPKHATLTPTRRLVIPPTYYTSPGRIYNAIQFSRKRKRTAIIPPPPAFTYQRTNSPHFNIFHGILLYPEIVFALATTLTLRDLISLYAISRDFHTILDTRFTTVVLRQSLSKAPECSRAFPFRSYAHLCRSDPAARIPHPNAAAAAAGRVRLVPSLRWLAMILHREKVVHEIMALFAEDGVPLPLRCGLAIKKMWFILDIPDNARRIGFIHNVNLFTDLDLYFAMCFFIKLDMRLNDPVGQQKRDGVRKMLLSQESFTTVLKVLRRDMWEGKFDVMRAWVKWKYEPRVDEVGMTIFGVPPGEIGKGKMEYWGRAVNIKRRVSLLLRPDQLVMREAVKRGLRFRQHFLRCLTYGYVRMDTLGDYEPRKMNRRLEALKDEYEADDEIGGLTFSMEKVGLEDSGDGDVLDLGERKSVSLLCIDGGSQSLISPEDRMKMEEQKQFLDACMQWAKTELEEGDVDARMLLD